MKERIWLITGISSGLGKAMTQTAILKGDFVIGTFRKEEQVEEFNSQNEGKALGVRLDLADSQSIADCIKLIQSEFGKIDVLVNNAGMGFVGAIEETSMEETRQVFETNFFGTLDLTCQALPLLRKSDKAHIVQISSHGGIKAFAGFGIYNASKFALEGFSEALAQEVEPLGIKLSIIEPGPFRTGFAGSGLGEAKKELADYADTSGIFRTKLKGVHGKQEGDPKKAAEAIFELILSENPPLRLPLGKIPLATISMKLESVKSDLERGRAVAESVVF